MGKSSIPEETSLLGLTLATPVFQEVLNHSMGPGRKSIGLAKTGGGPSLAWAGCNPTSAQILRTAIPFAAEPTWKRGRYVIKLGSAKRLYIIDFKRNLAVAFCQL